jgi:tRNA G18 (ribose-2'-O)-methylase SpoU
MKSKLIFGFHAVTARLRHEAESIEEIYVDAGRVTIHACASCCAQCRLPACA